jgi:hypothetical protein
MKKEVLSIKYFLILILFVGSKKISGSRMSLQHNKPKNSSKQGFEVFGCHIPQSIISHAKEYIKVNKDWDPSVFTSEIHYTTINAVAYDVLKIWLAETKMDKCWHHLSRNYLSTW